MGADTESPFLSRAQGSPQARLARVSCLGAPRLRKDWEDIESEALVGSRATIWETLWIVIFTMAIANSRDRELATHDMEWYALHIMVIYGAAFASIQYSTRFNDEDTFHTIFWIGFLFGVFGQVVFLNHNLAGFSGASAYLYLLLILAELRVGILLPRARVFCGWSAFGNAITASIFLCLALVPGVESMERTLLWLHCLVKPLNMISFVALTELTGKVAQWDVPLSIEHFIHRFQGLHMMVIVCSFLFPIALQGSMFCSSWKSMGAVLLASLYAIALKLNIVDTSPFQHASSVQALKLHAIRRSRWTSLAFVISFPVSILGIALAGVGFVAAVVHKEPSLVRTLVCVGSSMCWGTLTLHKLLHSAVDLRVHYCKVGLLSLCSAAFLFPLLLETGTMATLIYVVANMFAILGVELLLEGLLGGDLKRWQWMSPRLLKDWQDIQVGKQVGANVTSDEHLFTVLVAVAVFQLTELLTGSHSMEVYVLQYFIFYIALSASFTYASRFNDDDAAHKILWSLFQFGLLLMLEGAGSSGSDRWSVFKVSTAGMFLLLAVFFFGRVAIGLPRARYFAIYFAFINLASASIFLATCFYDTIPIVAGWAFVAVNMLADSFLVWVVLPLAGARASQLDVPMNIEYIESRFEGLFIEVLGVALIVPNAFYPGGFEYPWQVALGDLMAAAMAACFKTTFCDTQPLSFDHHAIRRAQWSAVAFLGNNCVIHFGVCLMGASMAMLIPGAGDHGPDAKTDFAQRCACVASSLFLGSLCVLKLLHQPRCKRLHAAKRMILAAGCGVSLLLLTFACGELSNLALLFSLLLVNVSVSSAVTLVNLMGPSMHAPFPSYPILGSVESLLEPLSDDEEPDTPRRNSLQRRRSSAESLWWYPSKSLRGSMEMILEQQ